MAVQRGQDGSATFAAVSIGNLRTWELDTGMGVIDTTVKGDKHQQVVGGIVSGTVTLTALLDYVTGQQDLIDFLETATPTSTPGSLVLLAASGKTLTMQALYTGHQIISPEGDNPVTVRFTFTKSGAAAVAWA
jgi:hypothetical protein